MFCLILNYQTSAYNSFSLLISCYILWTFLSTYFPHPNIKHIEQLLPKHSNTIHCAILRAMFQIIKYMHIDKMRMTDLHINLRVRITSTSDQTEWTKQFHCQRSGNSNCCECLGYRIGNRIRFLQFVGCQEFYQVNQLLR